MLVMSAAFIADREIGVVHADEFLVIAVLFLASAAVFSRIPPVRASTPTLKVAKGCFVISSPGWVTWSVTVSSRGCSPSDWPCTSVSARRFC